MTDKEETKIETEASSEEGETVEVQVEDPKTEGTSPQEATESSGETSQAEEIENYSKGVQERIKKLTSKYRQEERDREEAQRLSQKLLEENKDLKSRMKNLDQGYLMEYGTRLESQEEQAKRLYKEAHEAGDTDKMVEAQQALAKIAIEQERYRMAKSENEVEKETETVQAEAPKQPQAQPQPPKVSEKAKTWAEKNEWFGSDNTMTYAAFGIHKRMVEEEGFDPESDEYYSEIDKRMKDEFPHKFSRKNNGNGAQVAPAAASASRNTKQGRRSVKLTPSQIAMAKRLNVPLEEYARYVKD